ncbi:hypothetical protein CDLVIII_2146 [Clostridium sp. DL-VIII]|nr:hypothetical protein CDLVIII_2146 [Clostridium sp. DL-VIII]
MFVVYLKIKFEALRIVEKILKQIEIENNNKL